MNNELIGKINAKKAVIGIVGLGYVGLPLALRFAEVGFTTIGFDIDPTKITMLASGQSYIKHVSAKLIRSAVESGQLTATSDFTQSANVDVLIICVPTPLSAHREPDLSFVIKTVDSVVPYLHKGQLICLESTTYPGTTEEELKPRLEAKGLRVGEDIFLVFSPEREDPGNQSFQVSNIPKVVGGLTPACLEVGIVLYQHVTNQVVPVSSAGAAEFTKLLENIYRAVNIGLVNELKVLADRMGIDIWEVIDAAATKPFGFTAFYPGPGLGGHCIPIDPFYLVWKAREYGLSARFIELAGEINTTMPSWVITKITDALNDQGKSVKGARVLILGIAYKKNVDDMRESPAVELMSLLQEKGAIIQYSDPFVPTFPKMRKYQFDLDSVDLTPETLAQADCVVVATDHDELDYELIQQSSKCVVDTRGRYRVHFEALVKA